MAGNTLITADIIAPLALAHLENNLVMPKLVTRAYEKDFKEVGDTIRIRKPVQFQVNDGPDITTKIQDVNESTTTLVLNKYKDVAWKFSSKDLTLTVAEYTKRYIKPAAIALANQVDIDGLEMYKYIANLVGDYAKPAGYADIAEVAQLMDENAVPDDGMRRMVLSPEGKYGMTAALAALNTADKEVVIPSLRRNFLGRIANIDLFSDQNVWQHTSGAQTTVAIHATLTAASTLSEIAVNGLDANLVVGDSFSIAAVNNVNPISKKSTGTPKDFVVTTALTYTGTADTVAFSPTIVMSDDTTESTGPAYQNVDAYPLSAAVVTFADNSGTQYTNDLAFHKDGIALAMAPLILPDSAVFKSRAANNNISIRLIKGFDILLDYEVIRMDILYGWKVIYPELCVRRAS